jgi:F0F1-type ATP synthase assembly protein I
VNGVATSSSPRERAEEGNEDVAAPFFLSAPLVARVGIGIGIGIGIENEEEHAV